MTPSRKHKSITEEVSVSIPSWKVCSFYFMESYNLRSLQRRKGISDRTCHLHNLSGNRSSESFNPKVCLERLKLLECHDIQNSKFYLKNGKIIMKQNKSIYSNGKILLKILCIVILVLTSSIYWRDHVQSHSKNFIKKCSEVYPTIQKFRSAAVKFYRSILKQFNYSQPKSRSENLKSNPVIPKEKLEVRDMIRDYFSEVKKKNKIESTIKSSYSFIEEQCRTYVKEDFSSLEKKFHNTTLLDLENLTDYALESQGAKIVTAYDTELYGTFAVKVLNFNLWPGFSHFLVKYLKGYDSKGPNSILIPWKNPGDCWAFKGSRGRVQIELSRKIIITAVSVDHVPKEIIAEGNVESAPKEFSVFGVQKSGNQINKTYLGNYEYKTAGPSIQTFLVQPRVEIPFQRVEVIIKSNHGNEKYTCIYKIRIHGLK